jgi:hypothetical protein
VDFPDFPEDGDKFASSHMVYKYEIDKWKLVRFQPADSGIIDCGGVEPVRIKINGGIPRSNFSGLTSIDCGGVV